MNNEYLNKIMKQEKQMLEGDTEDSNSHPVEGENDDEDTFGIDKKLAEKAGLVQSKLNEDGEVDWIGTQKQWSKYEELERQEYPHAVVFREYDPLRNPKS